MEVSFTHAYITITVLLIPKPLESLSPHPQHKAEIKASSNSSITPQCGLLEEMGVT
jgi:hypothetical protein